MTIEPTSSFSYLRAGASCLPGIGPVVSCYTLYEATREMNTQVSDIKEDKFINLTKYSLCGAAGHVASIAALVVLAVLALFGGPIGWGLGFVFLIGVVVHVLNALWIPHMIGMKIILDDEKKAAQADAMPEPIPPKSKLAPQPISEFEYPEFNPFDSNSRGQSNRLVRWADQSEKASNN